MELAVDPFFSILDPERRERREFDSLFEAFLALFVFKENTYITTYLSTKIYKYLLFKIPE